MKTIILCGGAGTRLHEETEFKPKPLVQIGGVPILHHIMNIYAHFGYKEFILALGFKGDMIKDYFLTLSRYKDDIEFDMKTGNVKRIAKKQDFDYKIIFAETGPAEVPTGARVLDCLRYIPESDKYFMVTYGDGVSNIDINRLVNFHKDQEKRNSAIATISAVHPASAYGRISYNDKEMITDFREKGLVFDDYVSGGFFVFNREIVNYLDKDKMVFDIFQKLAKDGKLALYRHAGYWGCMDTMKHYIDLNNDWEKSRPWAVWEK